MSPAQMSTSKNLCPSVTVVHVHDGVFTLFVQQLTSFHSTDTMSCGPLSDSGVPIV